MVKIEKKSNTRFRIAIALFILAITTPFLLTMASQKSDIYWAIARPIPAGGEITREDLSEIAAEMGSGSHSYLTPGTDPVGLVATRSFLVGELLDSRFLGDSQSKSLEEVSIAVTSSDIPMATELGDYVAIFQLIDAQNGEQETPPLRVLSRAFISDINRKSSNFGNSVIITLSLDQSQIPILLAASSKGRLVVVGKNG